MWLQLWEWFVILIAFILAFGLYIKSWAPKSVGTNTKRAFYAFFVFVLLTHWAFSLLTLFQDRNNAGNYWWTDPWRPSWSLPPIIFSREMWVLLVVAVVLYFVRLTVPTRLVIAVMLFYAALGVDYTAGDGPAQAQPATVQESVKAACKAQIDGLAKLRADIDKRRKGGGNFLDIEIGLINDYRSNLTERKCGRFTDIANPFVMGTATFPRADSDTVMIVTEGFDGDGLLFEPQCGDSDGGDAKEATYEPDRLKCIYAGDKIGPIKLKITDDYSPPRFLVEEVATVAPAVSADDRNLTEEEADRIREQLRAQGLVNDEYADDELVVTTTPDLDQAVERGVSTSFIGDGDKQLQTRDDVGAFLQGSSERSRAARAHVEAAIRENYGDDEVATALDGSCYVALQPSVASQILGTGYFDNGKVLDSGDWRTVGTKDIYWLCIMPDWTIVPDATIRADCANPGLMQLRPVREDTPTVPSVAVCGERCTSPVPAATPSPIPSARPSPSPSGKAAPLSPVQPVSYTHLTLPTKRIV